MSLPIHLSIHLFFSLLAGFLTWRLWKKPWASFAAGILGGFLIDLDHFLDYFLAFGFSFNLSYFNSGYSFLKSDKIYIFFHGWEYVLVFWILVFFLKNLTARSFFLALSLGMFFHLLTDVAIDNVPPQTYSIIYRVKNNFDLEKLVYPDHWQEHLRKKERVEFP